MPKIKLKRELKRDFTKDLKRELKQELKRGRSEEPCPVGACSRKRGVLAIEA